MGVVSIFCYTSDGGDQYFNLSMRDTVHNSSCTNQGSKVLQWCPNLFRSESTM